MAKVGIRELRKYFERKPDTILVNEIVTLFKIFPEVKEYYQVKLSDTGGSDALDKYKKIIRHEIFPERGFGKLQLPNIIKAIKDYKKVSSSLEGQLDLMLFFIELGTQFIHEFGDIDEDFYDYMETNYEDACKLVAKEHLRDEWYDRFQQIVRDTEDTGYGFGDNIDFYFEKYFEE